MLQDRFSSSSEVEEGKDSQHYSEEGSLDACGRVLLAPPPSAILHATGRRGHTTQAAGDDNAAAGNRNPLPLAPASLLLLGNHWRQMSRHGVRDGVQPPA